MLRNPGATSSVVEVLRDLVAINSVNPGLALDAPGEAAVADYVFRFCQDLGLEVELQQIDLGRAQVAAWLRGPAGAPVLLLESHLDTVQVAGMVGDPFSGAVRDGRVYGRGACDAKGCLAAILAAIAAVVRSGVRPACTVALLAAADEEVAFQGVRHYLAAGHRADAAIVGEPTELQVVVAHKGSVRGYLEVRGRSAHSSRPMDGVNAITGMASVIAALEREMATRLPSRQHPLVGAPTFCITRIEGGSGLNTVPERCRIAVDRRLAPGEDPRTAWAEIAQIAAGAQLPAGASVTVEDPFLVDPAMETDASSPVVSATAAAVRAVLGEARIVGMPYATDGSKLAEAGIPTVVFGPGSVRQAHVAEEWVEVAQLEQAVQVIEHLIRSF